MKRTRRPQEDLDAELYSTSVLEQLMQSSEWRRVDEVLQLALRAVSDALSTHSQSLTDLKALLTTRASKTELTTGLSLKTNLTDVAKTVQELSQALQQRPSYQQVSGMLRDYASRADLVQILANQNAKSGHIQEEREGDAVEIAILKARMDDFQKEISKRVGACATLPELHEVLTLLDGKANVSELNEALQGKVSKQFLSTALQKKVSRNDLEALLAKKADTADLDYLIASIQGKVSLATLDRLHQVLQNKADKSELLAVASDRTAHLRVQKLAEEGFIQQLEQMRAALSLEIKENRHNLTQELTDIESSLQTFARERETEGKKAVASLQVQMGKRLGKLRAQIQQSVQSVRQAGKGVQEELSSLRKAVTGLSNDITVRRRGQENIYSEIDDVRKKLEQTSCHAVDKKQFIDFKSQVTEALSGRVEMQVMQTALDQITAETNSRLLTDKHGLEDHFRTLLKRTEDRLQQGATATLTELLELKKAVARKQERGETGADENLKRIRKDVEDCRRTVDLAYGEIHGKISVKEYEADLLQIRKRFQALGREVSGKANIKDVCVLADSKPNIDQVNSALREINEALATRVTEADLQAVLKDQATINQTLCAENIVGRWMWQSGQLRAGGLIPWEAEAANSVPDHYFWEKDKTSVLIISAGVYEVTACAFGRAILTVLANGETINARGEENSSGMANRGKPRRRKEKQVGSSSVCEYLMLPQRSRISISLAGEASEGLLNIRRL